MSDIRPSKIAQLVARMRALTASVEGRNRRSIDPFFNWHEWVLGLVQISSTTPHARKVVEKVMEDYFDNLAAREALVAAAVALVEDACPSEGHHAIVDRELLDALRAALVGKDAHLA